MFSELCVKLDLSVLKRNFQFYKSTCNEKSNLWIFELDKGEPAQTKIVNYFYFALMKSD